MDDPESKSLASVIGFDSFARGLLSEDDADYLAFEVDSSLQLQASDSSEDEGDVTGSPPPADDLTPAPFAIPHGGNRCRRIEGLVSEHFLGYYLLGA